MEEKYKKYISLTIWITVVISVGALIGSFTKPQPNNEIHNWYFNIKKSPLTPPNYIFPIAWTILYAMIGFSGWVLWQQASNIKNLKIIKGLYLAQMLLNWSWTPLFFGCHLIGLSLLVLILMDIIVALLIFASYGKIKSAAIAMVPYFLWILFATHLNLYIWEYN